LKRGDILKGSVFVVHWKSSETGKVAKNLKKEGWVVETESRYINRAFDRIRKSQPDAVVIYLNRSPKRGREVGFTLKAIRLTQHLPVVFVNGRDKVRERTKERVPEAIFSSSDELNKTLEKYSKEEK